MTCQRKLSKGQCMNLIKFLDEVDGMYMEGPPPWSRALREVVEICRGEKQKGMKYGSLGYSLTMWLEKWDKEFGETDE